MISDELIDNDSQHHSPTFHSFPIVHCVGGTELIKPEEESGPSDEKGWGGGHWEPDSRSDLTVEKMGSPRITSQGAGGGSGEQSQ